MHCYSFQAGPATHRFAMYADSDAKAIRRAKRWVRIFWHLIVSSTPEGSMARATAEGWYEKPRLRVMKSGPVGDARIIPADPWVCILNVAVREVLSEKCVETT